jgi:hypothetical protein
LIHVKNARHSPYKATFSELIKYSFIIIRRVTNGLNIIFNIKPSIPLGPTPRCVLPKLFEYVCRKCESAFVGTKNEFFLF